MPNKKKNKGNFLVIRLLFLLPSFYFYSDLQQISMFVQLLDATIFFIVVYVQYYILDWWPKQY